MTKKLLIPITVVMIAVLPCISFAQDQNSLEGRILLQTQEQGEAWYVNPADNKRYYLGRPADAFAVMREQGTGISNKDLDKIRPSLSHLTGPDSDEDGLPDAFETAIGTDPNDPDTSGNGYTDKTEIENGYDPRKKEEKFPLDPKFAEKQQGKILLQVERQGEAWYVDPFDKKRYYLGRPADAFQIMRDVGLGVSNEDLEMIETADPEQNPSITEEDPSEKNITLQASTNKNAYQEEDDLHLSVEISSDQDIEDLKIEAVGIVNDFGYDFFDKTRNTDLEKNKTKTIDIHSTLPECSSCTGITPGEHSITVTAYHKDLKMNEQEVYFDIQ